jgi:hypothetical protein
MLQYWVDRIPLKPEEKIAIQNQVVEILRNWQMFLDIHFHGALLCITYHFRRKHCDAYIYLSQLQLENWRSQLRHKHHSKWTYNPVYNNVRLEIGDQ